MHNSQNGGQVARGGSGVGWNSSGQLTGGSPSGPMNKLLVSSCVGCHTSTTSSTIINMGSSRIPIVYNTVQPVSPLAGGNFYWIAQGDSTKGHNVYGISPQDANLNEAPGMNPASCLGSCHETLAAAPSISNVFRGGCQGCHVFTSHHGDTKPWYRFLKGHGVNIDIGYVISHGDFHPSAMDAGDYVLKTSPTNESADWEQIPSETNHNYYKGSTVPYGVPGLVSQKSITAFCSGCHSVFHGQYDPDDGAGMGSASPWMRHPTDILFPNTGEYAGYDPVTNYSVEAPVAWTDPVNPTRGTAVVMCLSCHRAHGSDQPDMLRWDYSLMLTGGGGSGGCFTCHTNKN